jgi:hypothetical protein
VYAPKKLEHTGQWKTSNRMTGAIYDDDPVKLLRGIGKRATDVLAEKGVITVKQVTDYFHMSPTKRQFFCRRVHGFGLEKLLYILASAETSIPGSPIETDHRKANNPYLSRYGVANWKKEAENSPKMRSLTNVQTVVEHIIATGKANRAGTIFQDNWYFLHDGLSLMTAHETIEWMARKCYMKHWIFPVLDLNKNIPHHKQARPVGNHAQGNPWDVSLNKDHDDIVLKHVAATSLLDKNDPKKFSLATLNKVSSAYQRIYNNPPFVHDGHKVPVMPLGEGRPFPKRIGQDIMK